MPPQNHRRNAHTIGKACAILLGLLACSTLSGCLVAGYTSSGGGFVWPGGLGLVFVLLVLLWFLLRKR